MIGDNNMKKSMFVLLGVLLLIGTSCKNTLYITGTPGTKIYKPIKDLEGNFVLLGEINTQGELNMQLKKKDGYFPFLLADAANQENLIPFGTNIKKDKRYDAVWATMVIPWFSWIFVPICVDWSNKYFDYTPTSTNEDLLAPTKKDTQMEGVEIISY